MSTPQPLVVVGSPARPRKRLRAPGWAPFTFVALALAVSLSISQEVAPEPGSLTYWLLVLPALVLPLTAPLALVRSLFGPARWMTLFLVTAGGWHLLTGDPRASLQLFLLVLVTAWVASDDMRFRTHQLVALFFALIVAGAVIYATTDLNQWGPLPGMTAEHYGIWRVSFFPNIAYTAFLSLGMVFILTRNQESIARHLPVLLVAVFYLLTSFVRTALIALTLYAILRWYFSKPVTPKRVFWISLLSAIGVNAAIAGSVSIMGWLQEIPLISRLLLRGESGLSTEEIFEQLFRPWVWMQHFTLFLTSPSMMGWGAFDFNEIKPETLIDEIDWSDTVSLPTRLLAAYGMPALLFMGYLILNLWRRAREGDAWSCACFPPLILLLFQWGSVFHPSDGLYLVFLAMVLRGKVAFVEKERSRVRRMVYPTGTPAQQTS